MINKDIQKQEEKKFQKELRELETTNPERADEIKKAIRKKAISDRNAYYLLSFLFLIFTFNLINYESAFYDNRGIIKLEALDYLALFFEFLGFLLGALIIATIFKFFTKSEFSKTLFWTTLILTLLNILARLLIVFLT